MDLKNTKNALKNAFSTSVNIHGWGWSMRWEPLLGDFILLATKLDNLGFSYCKGKVSVKDMEKL